MVGLGDIEAGEMELGMEWNQESRIAAAEPIVQFQQVEVEANGRFKRFLTMDKPITHGAF